MLHQRACIWVGTCTYRDHCSNSPLISMVLLRRGLLPIATPQVELSISDIIISLLGVLYNQCYNYDSATRTLVIVTAKAQLLLNTKHWFRLILVGRVVSPWCVQRSQRAQVIAGGELHPQTARQLHVLLCLRLLVQAAHLDDGTAARVAVADGRRRQQRVDQETPTPDLRAQTAAHQRAGVGDWLYRVDTDYCQTTTYSRVYPILDFNTYYISKYIYLIMFKTHTNYGYVFGLFVCFCCFADACWSAICIPTCIFKWHRFWNARHDLWS